MERFSLFKVKDGKLEQWKNWCRELMELRHAEAVESLKDENVLAEASVLFKIGHDYYVLGFVKSMAGKEILKAKDNVPINHEHKRQREECLEKVSIGEILYRLP